jgi:hypothetical protein
MRTSTGLIAILVAALLAVASIRSPVRPGGWQEAQDSSGSSPWQALFERSGLEPSRWQVGTETRAPIFLDPIGLLRAWIFWPMETLRISFR